MHLFNLPFSKRITNERFQKLFVKNTVIVFLGIFIPLLIAVLAVYSYSHRSLLEETDAANSRSLENTRSTVDMIFSETQSLLLSYASNNDVADFLRTRKDLYPNYPYIERANMLLATLRASRRPYLDSAIILYSEVSDFTLSTALGGQAYSHYTDQEICAAYRRMKDREPERNTFFILRKLSYLSGEVPKWTMVMYRTIPVPGSPKYSFIAIDVSLEMLVSYLTGNTNSDLGAILLVDSQNQILFDSTMERIGHTADELFLGGAEQETFRTASNGSLTVNLGGAMQRMSWLPCAFDDWKCVQLIPFNDYTAGMNQLRNFLILTMTAGILVSLCFAYLVSSRLFRPVEAILAITENPDAYNAQTDRSGEIQYLLMSVLGSFQKNILLEDEMVEKMAALRNARAKALQEQMTPHFLYNALQAINWLALSETNLEDSRTSHSIVTLSEIVRTCMEQSDNFTTVALEIAYVQKFMEIEQLRFGDAVHCHYDVSEEVMDWKILRISLQPLVENAISHGIQPHRCTGNIYVTLRLSEGLLAVRVEDDGVGMSDEQMERIMDTCRTEYVYANQHVGLVNLSQRVKLIYGEEYQTRLGHSQYGGLSVEFTIPRVE